MNYTTQVVIEDITSRGGGALGLQSNSPPLPSMKGVCTPDDLLQRNVLIATEDFLTSIHLFLECFENSTSGVLPMVIIFIG